MSYLEKIVITDEDIDWIETIMTGVTFDECRRTILKRLDDIDVQAFPGTGKTTLLVAKLAILARKWDCNSAGICILSHTNVAREEIELRLGNTAIGKKLLSYPHFIGTVHGFFDAFVSLPYIRSLGITVQFIDTEMALESRRRRLEHGTKIYLEKTAHPYTACEAIEIPIKLNVKCSEESPSYQNIKQVIEEAHNAGEFTFQEMLLIAKRAISRCKYFDYRISARFPLLLIDEAQDTSALQWGLINSVFRSSPGIVSVRQGFGDCNQAIFNSYDDVPADNQLFPRKGYMTIADSKRFDSDLANCADRLAVYTKGMMGTSNQFTHIQENRVLFLFDKSDIEGVIPAFGRHVLASFSDSELSANHDFGVHIMGMVHNKPRLDPLNKKYPSSLADYYSEYNPDTKDSPNRLKSLIDYFRLGKDEFQETGMSFKLIERYAAGVVRLLRFPKKPNSFQNLLRHLVDTSDNLPFRGEFCEIVHQPISTEEEWGIVRVNLQSLLYKYFEVDISSYGGLEWNNLPIIDSKGADISPINQIKFISDDNRCVDMCFNSIHAAKGRTYLAALIVDTFWYESNFKAILPWLKGESPQINARNRQRLKCHYVAMSRAKALLGIAIPYDRITRNDVNDLEKSGWTIKRIDASSS